MYPVAYIKIKINAIIKKKKICKTLNEFCFHLFYYRYIFSAVIGEVVLRRMSTNYSVDNQPSFPNDFFMASNR